MAEPESPTETDVLGPLPSDFGVSRSGNLIVGEYKIGPQGISVSSPNSSTSISGSVTGKKAIASPFSNTRRLSRVSVVSSTSPKGMSSMSSMSPQTYSPKSDSGSAPNSPFVSRFARKNSDSSPIHDSSPTHDSTTSSPSIVPRSCSRSPIQSEMDFSSVPPSPTTEYPFSPSGRLRRPSSHRNSFLASSAPQSPSQSPIITPIGSKSSPASTEITGLEEIQECPGEEQSTEDSKLSDTLSLPPSSPVPAIKTRTLTGIQQDIPSEEKTISDSPLLISISDSPAPPSHPRLELIISAPPSPVLSPVQINQQVPSGFEWTPRLPVNSFVFCPSPSEPYRAMSFLPAHDDIVSRPFSKSSKTMLDTKGDSPMHDSELSSPESFGSSSSVSGLSKTRRLTVPMPSKESGPATQAGNTKSPNSQIPFSVDEVIPLGDIGQGQNGTVVKGFHLATLTRIALKSVNICLEPARIQLVKELNTYSKLSGPAFVNFLGACFQIDKGVVVLASEFMDCGSLEKVVSLHGAIPEPALRYVARKLVTALASLHEKRYLHRDLKPQNILCDHRGNIKLADFGIAKQLPRSRPRTRSFLGTASYLSPERLKSEDYSFPSDIWGLGLILLYCAIGGEIGLPAAYWDLMQMVTTSPPCVPKGKGFSNDFISFIDACLQIDPDKRATCKKLLSHRFLRRPLTRRKLSGKTELEHWLSCLKPDESDVDEIFNLLMTRTSFFRYFTKPTLDQMFHYYKLQSLFSVLVEQPSSPPSFSSLSPSSTSSSSTSSSSSSSSSSSLSPRLPLVRRRSGTSDFDSPASTCSDISSSIGGGDRGEEGKYIRGSRVLNSIPSSVSTATSNSARPASRRLQEKMTHPKSMKRGLRSLKKSKIFSTNPGLVHSSIFEETTTTMLEEEKTSSSLSSTGKHKTIIEERTRISSLSSHTAILETSPTIIEKKLPGESSILMPSPSLSLFKSPRTPLKSLTASPLVLSTSSTSRRLSISSDGDSPTSIESSPARSERSFPIPPSTYEFELALESAKPGDLLWIIDRLADQCGAQSMQIVQRLQSVYKE